MLISKFKLFFILKDQRGIYQGVEYARKCRGEREQ
jgi:hypothetical protein